MKTGIYLLMLAAGVMYLAGCSSPAEVQKDDTVDLNNYRTYMWVDTKDNETDNGKSAAAYAEIRMRMEVNAELQKRGWREVSTDPDALISYDILVERSVEQKSDPVYSQPVTRTYYNPRSRRWGTIYYPSQFLGYQTYQVPVKEGTITISVIDANSDRPIWQGWVTEPMNYTRFTGDEISRGVKQIFKKFEGSS